MRTWLSLVLLDIRTKWLGWLASIGFLLFVGLGIGLFNDVEGTFWRIRITDLIQVGVLIAYTVFFNTTYQRLTSKEAKLTDQTIKVIDHAQDRFEQHCEWIIEFMENTLNTPPRPKQYRLMLLALRSTRNDILLMADLVDKLEEPLALIEKLKDTEKQLAVVASQNGSTHVFSDIEVARARRHMDDYIRLLQKFKVSVLKS